MGDMRSGGAPLRFLVVDDYADIRDLFVDMLERLGHTAHPAADGMEAVESLAVARYDYMLLDLSMPRMNGVEVLQWLAQHPDRSQSLRVVVVSAWVEDHNAKLQDFSVHAVLPKPLSLRQLRDLIAESSPSV